MTLILSLRNNVKLSGRLISKLRKAGYHTIEAINNATDYEISKYAGITKQQAQNIKNKLKKP